jgi:hypothetical protein
MDQPVFFKSKKDSVWRGKHATLRDFYLSGGEVNKKTGKLQYDPQYYKFDKYELEIDPDEPMSSVEAYDAHRQQKEIVKCCNSFFYFCHKYVKILHPMKGLIPFVLYEYQRKVIRDYENYRFNIISKFRQGGLTTVTLLWGLWRCMFQMDQQIMLLSKTDREATDIGMMVDRSVENFPEWLKPKKDGKWNDHLKQFTLTGSALKFYSPEAARGKSVTFLIIDEAAFIDDMDKHWKAMWPVLSTGGSCALVSTVNGLGNWYEQTYHDAKDKRNKFHVIDLDYWEHPDYNDEKWVEEQKTQLGEKGFLQEVLREFLGSGDTYFPARVITQLAEQTRNNYPSRKLFPKWVNKMGRIAQLENEHTKGALWVWKEPVDGHEYIIGADCAEGQAENNDNSCFQIIDTSTLEQVAEFYSNIVVPHEFAQVLNEVGIYYNNALVVIENMGPGGAVLSALQHTLFYENLYYEATKGAAANKPGVKIGQVNRTLYLEALQNRLLNQTVRINSLRFATEIQTFEYNPQTKKAEAQKGKHDDAIIAMCIALYVRDSMLRDIPMGAEVPREITATLKSQVYEEIKRELMEGRPEDFLADEDIDLLAPDKDSVLPGVMFNIERRNDRLLREFGW